MADVPPPPPPPSSSSSRFPPPSAGLYLPIVNAAVEEARVVVWRLPWELSQSRLGGRVVPSNACTLIAVKLAELLHRNDVSMPYPHMRFLSLASPAPTTYHHYRLAAGNEQLQPYDDVTMRLPCPSSVMSCYVEAVVTGNSVHEEALIKRRAAVMTSLATPISHNFTIPEAIDVHRNTFLEVDFCSIRGHIRLHLPRYVRLAVAKLSVSVVGVAPLPDDDRIAFERAVLLVIERATDTITMFDTHNHFCYHGISMIGGLIASCRLDEIRRFSDWVSMYIFPEAYQEENLLGQDFELSLIRFCGSLDPSDCAAPSLTSPTTLALFKQPTPSRPALKRRNSDDLDELAIKKRTPIHSNMVPIPTTHSSL